MAATYEPIASVTTSGSAATVTFDSIAGTWTDLICVMNLGIAANNGVSFKINNDTSANFSSTRLVGNGSTTASARRSSTATVYIAGDGISNTSPIEHVVVLQVMSYANTNVFKTWLNGEANAASGISRGVGLWRSTNAVTRLDFTAASTTFTNGSTFSLYGIKAA